MPQQPDASYAPAVTIDDSRKWPVRLVGIDEQPSKFRDRRKDAMTLVHRFYVYDENTGEVVTDDITGDPYEQWMFAPDTTYDNPTSGKIAPAREIANALCGKRLTDDEVKDMIAAGWADSLVGKYAIADLEWGSSAEGAQRLKIIRLKPYKPKDAAPKAKAKAPAPPPMRLPVNETENRDEDEDSTGAQPFR
jgi:hypothetical protein